MDIVTLIKFAETPIGQALGALILLAAAVIAKRVKVSLRDFQEIKQGIKAVLQDIDTPRAAAQNVAQSTSKTADALEDLIFKTVFKMKSTNGSRIKRTIITARLVILRLFGL